MLLQLPPFAPVAPGAPEGISWMFGLIVGMMGLGLVMRAWRKHWKGFGGGWIDEPSATVGAGAGAGAGQRVVELEEQVTALRQEVSELAERVDFAERLLASKREQLEAGR